MAVTPIIGLFDLYLAIAIISIISEASRMTTEKLKKRSWRTASPVTEEFAPKPEEVGVGVCCLLGPELPATVGVGVGRCCVGTGEEVGCGLAAPLIEKPGVGSKLIHPKPGK
jgi:hypothetical protein